GAPDLPRSHRHARRCCHHRKRNKGALPSPSPPPHRARLGALRQTHPGPVVVRPIPPLGSIALAKHLVLGQCPSVEIQARAFLAPSAGLPEAETADGSKSRSPRAKVVKPRAGKGISLPIPNLRRSQGTPAACPQRS